MSFLCCGWEEKPYHVDIFTCQKGRGARLKKGISPMNVYTLKTEQDLSTNKLQTADLSVETNSIQAKEQRMTENSERIIEKQLFQIISPISVIAISAEELPHVLLELPRIMNVPKIEEGDYNIKMIKKSNYEKLLQRYQGKQEKWIDPDFKHAASQTIGSKKFSLSWENLEVISKRNSKSIHFIDKFIEPTDIIQSSVLGDCYFMSAVAALAKKSKRILRLFSSIDINPNGIFMARLMFKGILQEVVVDQFFPYNMETQELFGCRPCRNQSEIYVMILEKCWAKLWKSYQEIDGGFPHEALRTLSGALTKNYFFQNETSDKQKSKAFFIQAVLFTQKDYVMCTGTNRAGTVTILHRELGVIKIEIRAAHMYSLEQVFFQNDQRKVKIYNPWGHNLIAGTKQQVNGEFIIKWNDFIKNFYYITVCKIHDNSNYLYMQLSGCTQNGFKFIELKVENDEPCYYGFTLSESDRKQKHDFDSHRYITVTFVMLKEHQDNEYELIATKTAYKFSDHYLEISDLTRGKYLIAIYFTEVTIKENLTFSVYSEGKFGFKERHFDRNFQRHFHSQVLLNFNNINSHQMITRYPDAKNRNVWISFHMMIQDTILGYYLIHVEKEPDSGFKVMMSRNQFTELGLEPLPPYNTELIELSAKPGHETIMVLVTLNFEQFQKRDAYYYYNNKRHIHEDLVFGETFFKV